VTSQEVVSKLAKLALLDDMVVICRGHHVALEDVFGRCREAHVQVARVAVYAFLEQDLHWSRSAIGRLFERDHSAIVDALNGAGVPSRIRRVGKRAVSAQ
jgi:chromosomal replication initiation ATPase DnaA